MDSGSSNVNIWKLKRKTKQTQTKEERAGESLKTIDSQVEMIWVP